MHFFFKLVHCPGRFIFIACRTFFFAIGRLLRIIDKRFCSSDPLFNDLLTSQFEAVLNMLFFLIPSHH